MDFKKLPPDVELFFLPSSSAAVPVFSGETVTAARCCMEAPKEKTHSGLEANMEREKTSMCKQALWISEQEERQSTVVLC